MSWVLVLVFLNLAFGGHSEVRQEKKLPSAVVVGTVNCDTCFQEEFSKPSNFIPGASVAIECKDGSSRPIFRKEAKTDKHGKFRIHLPFSVSKHVKKIEGCSVTLIRSSEPDCSVATTANSSSLHLKSREQGMHIFSAGFFSFKPQKLPDLCNQKPSVPKTNKDQPPLPKSDEPLKTTQSQEKRQGHPDSLLPPLFPPLIPNPLQPPPLIPNPLQPPPLIPNPLQPPPAPLIPNPFQPPPAPVLPLPPVPGLTPSPTPATPMLPLPPIPGLTPSPPPATPVLPLPPIPGLNPSPPPATPVLPLPPVPVLPLPPIPVLPLPPVPGLTPSPSPPPPSPTLPLPFPPLFPTPTPRIPGIPPASSLKQTSP